MSSALFLAATTDKFDLITSAAGLIDCCVFYADVVSASFAPVGASRQNTAITTAATTDVLSAPGSSNTRNLKSAFFRNKDSTLNNDLTFRFNQNGTAYEIYKTTVLPGETLCYIEGIGFFTLRPGLNASQLLTQAESSDTQRILQSTLSPVAPGTFLTISGTAYYVYVGRVTQTYTPKFVEFHISTAGAGTDTKEVGLFSTPVAPNKSAQTLTKIFATGTVDSGTSTGVKRNTSANTTAVNAGTHLWAAYRGALATTQITALGLAADMSQGAVLTTTGGGALTGVTTASGALVAVSTATVAPNLRVTTD